VGKAAAGEPARKASVAPTPGQAGWFAAKALYSFEPQSDQELPFQAGDIIDIYDTSHGEWWFGQLQGKNGCFPSSYVERLPPDQTSAAAPTSSTTSDAATPAAPAAAGAALKRADALFEFKAASDQELELSAGDIVNVLDDSDAEWWRGEVRGKVGYFPSNYVRLRTEPKKK